MLWRNDDSEMTVNSTTSVKDLYLDKHLKYPTDMCNVCCSIMKPLY